MILTLVAKSMKEEIDRRCDLAFAAPPDKLDDDSSGSSVSTLEAYTSRDAKKKSKGHYHHHHHHPTTEVQKYVKSLKYPSIVYSSPK